MENNSGSAARQERRPLELLQLPPGFRFHPTDEELISHYLTKKVLDANFTAIAIAEVDMNKVEPWQLPLGKGNESSNPPLMEAPPSQKNASCFSASNAAPEKIQDDFTVNNKEGNNSDGTVIVAENPNPLVDPPSPLTQQFNDLPDLIEGFDYRLLSSQSDSKAQLGNYQDYDYNQGLMMVDEGEEDVLCVSAAVRAEDSSVVSKLESGEKRMSAGGGGDLYGCWDFERNSGK